MSDVTSNVEQYNCENCGGKLVYSPGTQHLTCEQCQGEFPIPESAVVIEELDFRQHVMGNITAEEQLTVHTVKCGGCGATMTLEPNVESESCIYCATPLVIADAHDEQVIRPKSLLPFKVGKKDAIAGFKKWLTGYFWIPNKLKKASVNPKQFRGAYLPFWTYDSDTISNYRGQRGEHYYVTETYTENGERKTRRVRKTRWYPVSGTVYLSFDDILIGASESVPKKYMRKLEPWDLESLVPFDSKFQSGYVTEKYQVDLEDGWDDAKKIMNGSIRDAVESDIGGDEQRINSINTGYKNTTYKHILLPVYLSAYRYKDKLYNFFVNARTGEVQGKRPISTAKVVIAILLGLLLIGAILVGANWDFVQDWFDQRQGSAGYGPASSWLPKWLRFG